MKKLKASFIPEPFKKYTKLQDINRVTMAFAVFVAGGLGLYLTTGLRAATYGGNKEAEAGVIAGSAAAQQSTGASGGSSVLFGGSAISFAPANLQAITGGNSVALLWDLAPGTVKTEVYRNNTLVATVTVGQGVIRAEKLGTRYIDKTITKGTTYQYKVRGLSASGTPTNFSAVISAKPPTNTTAIPTITVQNTTNPELNGYITTYVIPEIQTWFPKVSDAIAYPDYTPISTILLKVDPNKDIIAGALGTEIGFRPDWLSAYPETGAGTFVHELTHLIQGNFNVPGYITEGLAEWSQNWFMREHPGHVSSSTSVLTDGYSEGAVMLQWGQTKYSPGLIRKVNIAAHNNTYTDNLITTATGKTPQQLYAESQAAITTGTVAIKNGNNLCLDFGLLNGNGSNTATLQTCTNSAGQQFRIAYRDSILAQRKILQIYNSLIVPDANHCLKKSAEISNPVGWGCNFDDDYAQQWVAGDNGALISQDNGQCLTAANNATTPGTAAVTAPCDGSASQRWTLP